jgi:MFS transporter, MCT family, solute carrier family 16 (monocarboxylic acid transporters), member 10
VAFGMAYVPSFGIIAHYFRRRRALAMGIAASGASVGGLIHPIMLNKLFHGPTGFRNGVRASAAFNSGLLILAMLLMRTRLPPRPNSRGSIANIRLFIRDRAYVFTVAGFELPSHFFLLPRIDGP